MDFETYQRLLKGFFRASEANEMTKGAVEENINRELACLFQKIKEAISEEKFSVSIDGSLKPYIRSKLEELGYEIKVGSQYNESYYTISWK